METMLKELACSGEMLADHTQRTAIEQTGIPCEVYAVTPESPRI